MIYYLRAAILIVAACGAASSRGASDASVPLDLAPDAADPALAVPADPSAPGPYPVGTIRRTYTRDSSTTGAPRPLDTTIWYPSDVGGSGGALAAHGRPFPVVLFSHGSCGIPGQSTFYTEHLASWGYVVAAPPHPGNEILDADCNTDAAQADAAANRPDDVIFVRDQLLDEPFFAGALDAARVAVSGHSFGGWTAMIVAGRGAGFVAALPMAPARIGTFARPAMPVFVMGGTIDDETPYQANQVDVYEQDLARPRFLLGLIGAGHFHFTLICPPAMAGCDGRGMSLDDAHTRIDAWSLAFFQRYVRGLETWAPLLAPAAAAADPMIEYRADP